AYVTIAQKDLKRLIAFSSVSHMGFVMLGIFLFNIEGLKGGLIQMINEGISKTQMINSRTVRPRETRAMNMPTKGAQEIHHAQ
ncbi:hypothetical protein LCGC14_1897740, partial [marine sediment metagenome]